MVSFGKKKAEKVRTLVRTNPLDADTDRDGVKDGAEVLRYRSDPNDWDTDNGGVSDGRELKRGTNPLTSVKTPRASSRDVL